MVIVNKVMCWCSLMALKLKKRSSVIATYILITIILLASYYLTALYAFALTHTLIITSIIVSLYIISPAYVSNGFAVLFGRNGHPIDGGRNFFDNNRILGDGKTIEGFIGGTASGFIIGYSLYFIVTNIILPSLIENQTYLNLLQQQSFLDTLSSISYLTIFVLSIGALLGDLMGSFLKRRLKLDRGEPVLFLDQLDFVLGALILGFFFMKFNLLIFLTIIFITPAIHFISNVIANLLHLKKEPW